MSASAHYDALFQRLNSRAPLAGNGADSVRVTEGDKAVRENYWILFAASPRLAADRYTERQTTTTKARYRFDFRPVGTTRLAVLAFFDAAAEAIGETLAVPGRTCDPLVLVEEVEGGRVLYDRGTRLFYLDVTFQLSSRPSPPSPSADD